MLLSTCRPDDAVIRSCCVLSERFALLLMEVQMSVDGSFPAMEWCAQLSKSFFCLAERVGVGTDFCILLMEGVSKPPVPAGMWVSVPE